MTSSRVRCMKASDQKCKSVINQSFGRIVPMSIMILNPPPPHVIYHPSNNYFLPIKACIPRDLHS